MNGDEGGYAEIYTDCDFENKTFLNKIWQGNDELPEMSNKLNTYVYT